MKAVILAAGKSIRTYPLTQNKPKVFLRAANKPLIIHALDSLIEIIDEALIVVGYQKEMVKGLLSAEYNGIKITYIEQDKQLGTGHALLQARNNLKGKFIVINGDCIFSRKDIMASLKHKYAVLAAEVKHPEHYGVFVLDGDKLKGIEEKPKKPKSNLVNAGLYVLDEKIFDALSSLKKTERGEIELTDAVVTLAKKEQVKCVKSCDYWFTITFPWDLLDANSHFLSKIKTKINGTVERNAELKGEVVIGKGTVVKNGAYIEGPAIIGENCTIGPNCYIRSSTSIGDNCKVGNAVEVKNSILGNGTKVGHLSYIGDSILGDNVNFGAGTIIANLKHDNSNIMSVVNGRLLDTGRRKLGTICGDGVHTGINTSIYPGRKLFTNASTLPAEIVNEDKQR